MKTHIPSPKKYPLSYICVFIIILLSVLPFEERPELGDIPLLDKWTHMVMYGGLSLVAWSEHMWHHHQPYPRRAVLFGYVCPVLLGVVMELVQWPLAYRSCEFMDMIANTTGATITSLIGLIIAMRLIGKALRKQRS